MPFIGMLILLVVFCAVLIFIMYRILGQQAHEAQDRFSSLSEDYEAKKNELKKLTRESQLQSEKLIAEAQREADRLRSESTKEANQYQAKMVEEARREADRIVQDAVKAREAVRQELVEQMHGKTIEAASKLVLRVLSVRVRQDVHAYWLDDLLEHGLQALDRFQSNEGANTAEIETAFALSDENREKIVKTIEKKIGKKVQLKEKVNPDLIAGLRISIGHLVLEGTLISRLEEAVLNAQNGG